MLKDGGTPAEAARAGLDAYVKATIFGIGLLGISLTAEAAKEVDQADKVAQNPRATERNTAQAADAVHSTTGGKGAEATNAYFADLGFTEDDGAEVAAMLDRWSETGSIASQRGRRARPDGPQGRNRQPEPSGGGGYTFGGGAPQTYGGASSGGGYTF